MRTSPVAATMNAVRLPNFAKAVAVAEKAYAKTGAMIDAALAYADHGIPCFPVDPVTKSPIAPRVKDANGNPIPGTGGFKRATTDRDQLQEWWPRSRHGRKHSEPLIGIPMGPLSGVWAADIDTKAGGHSNEGFTAWKALQDEHGTIVTRQHVTRSGGLHELFLWDDANPVSSGRGKIPKGIDIKGYGGYICAPPSKSRKGNRAYDVLRDVAPIEAPAWLYALVERPAEQRRHGLVKSAKPRDPSKPSNNFLDAYHEGRTDIARLTEAMAFVPNHELVDWDEWTAIGMALYISTGGSEEGFKLFDEFSHRPLDPNTKYDNRYTRYRWNEISNSPPDRTGPGKLFAIAIENGWRKTEPTHKAAETITLDDAREIGARLIERFLFSATDRNFYQLLGYEHSQFVQALRMDTGVGKTRLAIMALARWFQNSTRKRLVHFVVPTRKLIAEIVNRFLAEGIVARAYYGRGAPDPDRPDDQPEQQLCLRPDVVKAATDAKMDISKTCCRTNKENICPLFDVCAYQRQGRDAEDVQVWVFASDYLFIKSEVLGKADLMVIDEKFWDRQLRGLDTKTKPPPIPLTSKLGYFNRFSEVVGEKLAKQPDDGGLQWKYADQAGTPQELRNLINEYHDMMPELDLSPGMTASQFKDYFKRHPGVSKQRAAIFGIVTMLKELRQMVKNGVVDVSGRLLLSTDAEGRRQIAWRGVAPVLKQYRVPCLLLDATLPDPSILKVSHPDVEIIGDISVPYPDSVRVRQVLYSPTTKTKLIDGESAEGNAERVQRYIEQRYIETGRQPTLVICQEAFENLMKGKLPDNISFVHFNNLAGLDAYGHVRLLIVVGRVAPGPVAAEEIASTLSGSMVPALDNGDGFTWYDRVPKGIRMKDGSGVAMMGDQHPHPLTEAVRWLINEGELLQAIGRPRGVNRTPETPLDIDVLCDEVLPIAFDELPDWVRPSRFVSTAIEGVMLESRDHLTKLWPDIFPDGSARNAIKAGVPMLPGFEKAEYQLAGARQRWRPARFDRTVIPDPVAWLTSRFGPVTLRGAP